ncbi:hypothetical protein CMV_005312 [Castanea mollissima]|uniref:Uncharacterized protein n=1 Tax=Castanea mollissima TaxID=60419 RepID=A0A8J4VUG2_9ROSI|nr:hypothetical protein CMV_005312 [Castanea mollissima]
MCVINDSIGNENYKALFTAKIGCSQRQRANHKRLSSTYSATDNRIPWSPHLTFFHQKPSNFHTHNHPLSRFPFPPNAKPQPKNHSQVTQTEQGDNNNVNFRVQTDKELCQFLTGRQERIELN